MSLSYLMSHAHLAVAHTHAAVAHTHAVVAHARIGLGHLTRFLAGDPTPSPVPPGGNGGGLVGCDSAANSLNPCAQAPDSVKKVASTLIMWTRWTGMAAGVFGLMSCGVMMAIGRRNRSHLAGEGASGIPWVLGGLSVIALAYGVVSQVLS